MMPLVEPPMLRRAVLLTLTRIKPPSEHPCDRCILDTKLGEAVKAGLTEHPKATVFMDLRFGERAGSCMTLAFGLCTKHAEDIANY